MKYAGIILLILSSGLTGILLSKRLGERVELLRRTLAMLDRFSTQIRWQASTVEELLRSELRQGGGERLSFLEHIAGEPQGGPFPDAWKRALGEWKNPALEKEDRLLLETIGETLGSSDVEGQLASIALQKETCARLLEQAAHDRERKGKLYRSLGVLAGVFVSILLL